MRKRLAVVTLVLFAACSTSAQPARAPAPQDVAATVGATTITLEQVDRQALRQPASDFGGARLGQALYAARRVVLDELIGNELLDQEAKARGTDRASLVEKEIASSVQAPTDADVQAWYQANPARVQGASFDQVRAPIRSLLIQQRMAASRERFLDTLKQKTRVNVALEPPREKVDVAGYPSKGPSDAPVVMVEFSDFQCPFCQRAEPTVEQVLKTYGNRIKFVYRHFPLPSHPNARPAAEAAACAEEQGHFWEYHQELFANPNRLSADDLKAHANAIGLDAARFTTCVENHKTKARVDNDIKEANEAGVTGTPAFFVNGRPIEGAQPFEAFKQVIDEELARSTR
jgi:protein-disulfide isomerase